MRGHLRPGGRRDIASVLARPNAGSRSAFVALERGRSLRRSAEAGSRGGTVFARDGRRGEAARGPSGSSAPARREAAGRVPRRAETAGSPVRQRPRGAAAPRPGAPRPSRCPIAKGRAAGRNGRRRERDGPGGASRRGRSSTRWPRALRTKAGRGCSWRSVGGTTASVEGEARGTVTASQTTPGTGRSASSRVFSRFFPRGRTAPTSAKATTHGAFAVCVVEASRRWSLALGDRTGRFRAGSSTAAAAALPNAAVAAAG